MRVAAFGGIRCMNGARYLAERGLSDGRRLAISLRHAFQVGASYHGASDAALLLDGPRLPAHRAD